MKNPLKVISLSVFLAAVCFGALLIQRQLSGARFKKEIARRRQEIDHFMRYSENSPFGDESKKNFSGLQYFPPDPKFRVNAAVVRINGTEVVSVLMNDGSTEDYYRYGFAEFRLKKKPQRLMLLKAASNLQSGRLFLAFTDNTNGSITYGGGRYINLFQQTEGRVTIDFNMAYNPYCVYNADYVCPLPPAENRMSIPVRAGEKLYLP
jgi:uncharacterized protein (DUF1684 family)